MEIGAVPEALRERLGRDATSGLVELLGHAHREQRAELIAACTERFERRLVEEIAGVRVQIAQVEASVRQDMAEMGASIRQEMAQMGASIRQEMAQMGASIRQEMAQMGASIRLDMAEMGAGIRQDMAAGRVELLKWCFLFWIGQVVAVGTMMGVMLRLMR
jgi:hypothetical protein